MPDVIRHPAGGGGEGLDSCFRRNDGRLHRIVICASGSLVGICDTVKPFIGSAGLNGPMGIKTVDPRRRLSSQRRLPAM